MGIMGWVTQLGGQSICFCFFGRRTAFMSMKSKTVWPTESWSTRELSCFLNFATKAGDS